MFCQIDEVVFLICRFFFYLQHVYLFGCIVSICSTCAVKLSCFLNLHVFFFYLQRVSLCCEYLQHVSVFAACLFIWLCYEHLQRVCCQIDYIFFFNLQVFFSIYSMLSSLGRRTYRLNT